MSKEHFELITEAFSALAHPKRLEIVHVVGSGERHAGEIAQLVGLSKANASQHLNILKAHNLVHCDKRGTFCYYTLTTPKLLQACELMRQAVLDQMKNAEESRKALAREVGFSQPAQIA